MCQNTFPQKFCFLQIFRVHKAPDLISVVNIFDKIRRSEVLHQSISFQQNWMVYPENSKGKVVIEDTEMHHICNFKKHLVCVGNFKRNHPCSFV